MDTASVHFEVIGDERGWFYVHRSPGNYPSVPLHTLLEWIVEQVNFGCFAFDTDETGDPVSVVLGRDAAIPLDAPSSETAAEHARERGLALHLAGLVAEAREAGAEPKCADFVNHVSFLATDDPANYAGTWTNTELHYASRFATLLARIHNKMFVFSCPPIKRALLPEASRLLREATRAYLYEQHGAAVALCRALVESALKARSEITESEVRQEMGRNGRKGELQARIDVAWSKGLLTKTMKCKAHQIRKLGNDLLHQGQYPTDDQAWQAVLDIRFILEELV